MMGRRNILKEKTYAFALRIIKLYKYLKSKEESIMSGQLLRSGTAIGAMVHEAEFGQSKADFISKLSIGLKEANESSYWLQLLKDSGYISEIEFESIHNDCLEIIRLLVSSINTAKRKT
jgi:four helix bundle protein